MIATDATEASRAWDQTDTDNQARCWSFFFHHHGRKDQNGVVFEKCDKSAEDCQRSHSNLEAAKEEALMRREKLRTVQFERKGARKDRKTGKGEKGEGQKGKKAPEATGGAWQQSQPQYQQEQVQPRRR